MFTPWNPTFELQISDQRPSDGAAVKQQPRADGEVVADLDISWPTYGTLKVL